MTSESNPQNNDEQWQPTFNMFKLEYEQAAQRYENIYRAIWQIFQYMAFLAGGILTFASKSNTFSQENIIFFALTPLVFWFLAIYIPMNKNGKNTKKCLTNIEEKIKNNSQ
ncbi:hypothetical protein PCC7424_1398 [Gloeothece citriformis PCC 7424]|uniref:2TM domain-containing protein n=1 Tax=Gloeothece citriformis (strain PCC 7424) TaxID=65393 RepID=B7K882_GLOC7|nr:hypothetical protein [Gloeothece citriformis]ACK69842.1 hypothetical protein PCC7424_1398 [Gloeothece citriformis PCC 7424]